MKKKVVKKSASSKGGKNELEKLFSDHPNMKSVLESFLKDLFESCWVVSKAETHKEKRSIYLFSYKVEINAEHY